MRTKEEILKQMEEEMPFEMIGKGQMPYILEAMEVYAQEQVKNTTNEPVPSTMQLDCRECVYFGLQVINKEGGTSRICKAKQNDHRIIVDMTPTNCKDYKYE